MSEVRDFEKMRLQSNEYRIYPEWSRAMALNIRAQGADRFYQPNYVSPDLVKEQLTQDTLQTRWDQVEVLENEIMILQGFANPTPAQQTELMAKQQLITLHNWKTSEYELRRLEGQYKRLEILTGQVDSEQTKCTRAISGIMKTVDKTLQDHIQTALAVLMNDKPCQQLREAVKVVRDHMRGDTDTVRNEVFLALQAMKAVQTYAAAKTAIQEITTFKRTMESLVLEYGGVNPVSAATYYQTLQRLIQSPALGLLQMTLANNQADKADWPKIVALLDPIIERQIQFERNQVTQVSDSRVANDIRALQVQVADNSQMRDEIVALKAQVGGRQDHGQQSQGVRPGQPPGGVSPGRRPGEQAVCFDFAKGRPCKREASGQKCPFSHSLTTPTQSPTSSRGVRTPSPFAERKAPRVGTPGGRQWGGK
jgi:hypothetical protein